MSKAEQHSAFLIVSDVEQREQNNGEEQMRPTNINQSKEVHSLNSYEKSTVKKHIKVRKAYSLVGFDMFAL